MSGIVVFLFVFGCCVLFVLFIGFHRHLAFLFTYSPISGNSQSKTKRFYDRLSFERARHGPKKKVPQKWLNPLNMCVFLISQGSTLSESCSNEQPAAACHSFTLARLEFTSGKPMLCRALPPMSYVLSDVPNEC